MSMMTATPATTTNVCLLIRPCVTITRVLLSLFVCLLARHCALGLDSWGPPARLTLPLSSARVLAPLFVFSAWTAQRRTMSATTARCSNSSRSNSSISRAAPAAAALAAMAEAAAEAITEEKACFARRRVRHRATAAALEATSVTIVRICLLVRSSFLADCLSFCRRFLVVCPSFARRFEVVSPDLLLLLAS